MGEGRALGQPHQVREVQEVAYREALFTRRARGGHHLVQVTHLTAAPATTHVVAHHGDGHWSPGEDGERCVLTTLASPGTNYRSHVTPKK
ncbi:hypothetical protein Hamer_G017185 [Homarus americanus]|uniref:Uncharacterized protein n=1 Tax=Homarus americanus TaxID=6706 RepID=A0A8J5K587_HOMAM|nr:hypothetical protein Hamer_G017185 [Homarus americanus]